MNSIAAWMKLEIVRMLHEGVSEEGIKVVVEAMDGTPGIIDDSLSYANFVEYGRRPESHVVEGTVVYPVTDEQHLLPEGKP